MDGGNRSNLGVQLRNSSAGPAPRACDFRECACCGFIKHKDSPGIILSKHLFCIATKLVSSLADRQKFNAIENLGYGDGGSKELIRGSQSYDPVENRA